MTGLGGGAPVLMDGQPTGNKERDALIKECARDAYKTFFKGTSLDYDYCDAQARESEVRLGIEPTYMYQHLKMIVINEDKKASEFILGYAVGAWASAIRKTKKFYLKYKRTSKFTRFVDKWHPQLFPLST